MTDAYIDMILKRLRRSGCQLAPGLTDQEVDQIEARYGFRFPPDLRRFLQKALPVSDPWVNWRDESKESIRERLDRPADGICIDIEYNNIWKEDWGPRPEDLQEAFLVARQKIVEAPTLIPIYAHRYIPDEPHAEGNPVFSVIQTDIIYYGYDLLSYFISEMGRPSFEPSRYARLLPDWAAKSPREIRLWSDFAHWEWHVQRGDGNWAFLPELPADFENDEA